MVYFAPDEELLGRDALAQLQRRKLAQLLTEVRAHNPFYQAKLREIDFDPLCASVADLPFTTREEIQKDQADHPPYGSNLTQPAIEYVRMHQSSGSSGGPVRWQDTSESWAWFIKCWGIIYRAAVITQSDRFAFPFSFGPFIGFWAAFEAATSLGNFCLSAGGMTTSARLRYFLENGVTAIGCTPTYALRMAEVATAEGIDLASSSVAKLIVAGEPGGSIPQTRKLIESAWGAAVFDHAGMTEIGPWGFQCPEDHTGMYIIESEFIAEVVNPVTGETVGEGESGELVLTNLGRLGSPLIRYRTGDQVRLTHDRRAGQRWFARLDGGILGRVDDMLIIRGNNVFPSTIEGIIRSFEEVAEYRLHVYKAASLTELDIEVEPQPDAKPDRLAERLAIAVRDQLHFRPVVRLAAPGTLPRFEMKAKRVIQSDR